jgi:hypothetical protein
LCGWSLAAVLATLAPAPDRPAAAGGPKELACLKGHTNVVASVALTADGRTLVSGGHDKTVKVWDVAAGRERVTLRGHDRVVDFVAITPDGTTAASVDQAGVVKLWDVAAGRERASLTRTGQGSALLDVTADGRTLTVVCGDGVARQWDVATGRQVASFPCRRPACVTVSPDGATLAWADAATRAPGRFWDVPAGRERAPLPQPAVPQAFTPDGRGLVTITHEEDTLRVWEMATGRVRATVRDIREGDLHAIAVHPGGRVMAWAYGKRGAPLRLVDVVTGATWAELRGGDRNDGFRVTAFSADGTTLAAAEGPDTAIRVWDVRAMWRSPGPGDLSDRDLEALWADLAGEDAAQAYQTIVRLAGAPGQAVPWLGRHLRPVAAADERRTAELIADLESDRFAVRDAAARALEKLGESAGPALRRALAGAPGPETRRRVAGLLDALGPAAAPPDRVRVLRAVEALEHAGTPEARRVLETLAGGLPDARLTRDARAALARLATRRD